LLSIADNRYYHHSRLFEVLLYTASQSSLSRLTHQRISTTYYTTMAPSRRIRQIFAPGEFTATTTIIYKSATPAIDNTPPNIIAASPKPLSDFERKLTAGVYGRPGNM